MSSPAVRLTSSQPPRELRIVRDQPPAAEPRQLAALRVPLAVKLVGANAFVLLLFASIWLYLDRDAIPLVVFILFVSMVAIHLALALIALKPISDLEALATRIWRGD